MVVSHIQTLSYSQVNSSHHHGITHSVCHHLDSAHAIPLDIFLLRISQQKML